jgi:tetratricopeptide (TPR) repeat protein
VTSGFPDRLSQLRLRWQSDPSSRIFLQLSEEYRHLGRVREALEVLDSGLKEHPGYLSALVAKGRCHLELGEASEARSVLERVVQQDATQMVANKLLVRAYLETGDAERARQRLDLYTLLTERDPEVEELTKRIVAMSRSPQDVDQPLPGETAERPPMASSPANSGSAPPAAPRAGGDVFDLGDSSARRATTGEVFQLPPELTEPPLPNVPAPVPSSAGSAPTAPESPLMSASGEVPESPGTAGAEAERPSAPTTIAAAPTNGHRDPFPGLDAAHWKARYLDGLASEGLFFRERLRQPAAESAVAAARASTVVHSEPVAESIAAPSGRTLDSAIEQTPPALPRRDDSDRLAPSERASEAAAFAGVPHREHFDDPAEASEPTRVAENPSEEPATATLGFLYLHQGHLEEAERIFGEVLHREPDNSAVRGALNQLMQQRAPVSAAQLLAGFTPTQGAKVSSKKAHLLNRYLQRLRSGSPHVS